MFAISYLADVSTLRKISVFLFLLTGATSGLFAQKNVSIEWGRPIRLEDFEAAPNEQDTAVASISVTIRLGYLINRQGVLEYDVVAVMDRDESWIKAPFRNNTILRHEQGHFDIAHIFARRLSEHLQNQDFIRADVPELHQLYDVFLNQMNAFQVQYDRETQGGLDHAVQTKWEAEIERQLAPFMQDF